MRKNPIGSRVFHLLVEDIVYPDIRCVHRLVSTEQRVWRYLSYPRQATDNARTTPTQHANPHREVIIRVVDETDPDWRQKDKTMGASAI